MRLSFAVAAAAAASFVAGAAQATTFTLNATYDLASWYVNPGYGTSVISSPVQAPDTGITVQAGDNLVVNVNFLAGQRLVLTNLGGPWTEEIIMSASQSNSQQGVVGTYTASLTGVTGNPAVTSATGTLNGQNFLFADFYPSTPTSLGFTGFTFDIQITGMRDGYYNPNPAPTFTLNSFYFQAYADTLNTVLREEVPEPAMLGLFGLGALALGIGRRRR